MPVDEYDKDGVQLHKLVRLDALDPVTRARRSGQTPKWCQPPEVKWSDDVLQMIAEREQKAKEEARLADSYIGSWQWSDKAWAARARYEQITGHKVDWEQMARERAEAKAKTEWWLE
jgi:hypothetical protein